MNTNPDYITTTHGMSGNFAVFMRWYADIQAYDVLQSGIGRYKTIQEAQDEAKAWAEAEQVEYRP
jgi:hypothetical protein